MLFGSYSWCSSKSLCIHFLYEHIFSVVMACVCMFLSICMYVGVEARGLRWVPVLLLSTLYFKTESLSQLASPKVDSPLYSPTFRLCHSQPLVWVLETSARVLTSMQRALYYAFTPPSVDLFFFKSIPHWFINCNFMVGFEIRKFTISLLYRDHCDPPSPLLLHENFRICLPLWGLFWDTLCLACRSIWVLLPLCLLLPVCISHCMTKWLPNAALRN